MMIAYILCALGLGGGVYWLTMILLYHGRTRATGGGQDGHGPVLSACRRLAATIRSIWPKLVEKKIERDGLLAEKAGLFSTLDGLDILGLQTGAALVGLVAAPFLFSNDLLISACIGILAGWWLPRWWLNKRNVERQQEIAREFPTALDMITLGLEGGLDFAAGIKETVDNADEGPVREEFARVVHDIAMGQPRSEALRRFARRVDAIEIKMVVTSLIQAIELGTGIVETLRTQAEQMRYSRLMKAEEQAQKAPTKMMLPMVLFILPCVFIIIFAPIVVSLIATYRSFSP